MSDEPATAGAHEPPDADAVPDIDPADLERLNPRVRLIWFVYVLVGTVVLTAVVGGAAWFLEGPVALAAGATFAIVLLVGIVHTLLRFRAWGFVFRDDSLYLQRGVVIRVQTVVPYVRIQHVDTRRSPLERLTGLASTVVYTAGSRGADVSIPGLEPDRARTNQEHLKDLANVSGHDDAV